MSGHAQLLDRVARLADEHVIDAIHVVRRKRFHWPVVIGLTLLGTAAGLLVPVAPWFFAPSLAFVGMGLGMNLRSQWRVVARTSSRLLLLDASSVDARPTAVANGLRIEQLTVTPHRFWATMTIDGRPHIMTRQHLPRLQRMLDLPPG
jgi:hypothetical protein